MSLYTEKFTAHVADGISAFLYNLGTDSRKLVERQRKTIETTMKADPEAIEEALRIVDSKFSRCGPSS